MKMSYVGHAVHEANVAGLALQASRVKTVPVKLPRGPIKQAQMIEIYRATKDASIVEAWARASFDSDLWALEANVVLAVVDYPGTTEQVARDYYTKYGC